jgi:hypothetical protein
MYTFLKTPKISYIKYIQVLPIKKDKINLEKYNLNLNKFQSPKIIMKISNDLEFSDNNAFVRLI